MKKSIFLVVSFFSCIALSAQAPSNYYATATGNGYTLKSQLKTIITASHNPLTYADLWDLYSSNSSNNGFKDKYYENDNTILDIYTEKPAGSDTYNFAPVTKQCGNYKYEGDCYNREHLIPQSYFNEELPMKADAFHVWPTDGKVNGERGNYAFGNVTNGTIISSNGTKRGPSNVPNFTGTVVEPIDEFKGDIARAFFYFATRYEDDMDDFHQDYSSSEVSVMFDGSIDKVFNTNFLNILYQWHLNDPVSQREIDFNNLVYSEQGNRNPFIDQPNYVYDIWYQSLNTNDFNPEISIVLYPNPSNQNKIYINTNQSIDELYVYSIDGRLIVKNVNPVAVNGVYQIENLNSGTYILKVISENKYNSATFTIE